MPMATKERDPLNIKIGAAIKAARERRQIPARAIAEAIGTTVGAVGNWESGQNSIAAGNFFKVADFLDVDARALSQGELVFLDDKRPDEPVRTASAPTAPVVMKLWAVTGEVLKLRAQDIDQIVDVIAGRLERINHRPARQARSKTDG